MAGFSSDVVPLGKDFEEYIGLVFHPYGVYAMRDDGKYTKVQKESWSSARCALALDDGKILVFHSNNLYTLASQTLATTKLGTDWGWSGTQAVVRSTQYPDSIFAFHFNGVYKVNVADGANTQINSSGWSLVSAGFVVPGEPEYVYLFHDHGLYKVALADGSFEKIGTDKWAMARAAIYLPEEKAALVLHAMAMYKVQLPDGACTKVNSSSWSCVKGLMTTREPDQVLVFHDWGMFKVNTKDGSHQKLSGEGWSQVSAVAPFGSVDGYISVKPHADNHGGGGGHGGGH
mmetsp:Transcript_68363/g.164050  ORF Transcript_68363/g.164050 Transcript_68363/m.164050 type:complete len:288 (+) Transcript_68363:126-989(+)|eukprot:CAMPEP_0178431732 /NCGR_PEP_ID=MMETSP0689_2-20121128/32012_1 /TAXON_ID=160604 /ORGANISM="Amphidinium massartii, Strain CS-259" /LENGTH=287 /DNA_ID=CAMNT_0020053679 /DNA_START=59 /DNA_END=922 /DNA_ORIENTATION=+